MPGMKSTQLEFSIQRPKEEDRNFHKGGRSFYFFDFDDNIACLTTPLILFHKTTNAELSLSSQEWALAHSMIGRSGPYEDYEIRYNDKDGTFKHFRDQEIHDLEKLGRKNQIFESDVAHVLGLSDLEWKGPSWDCFYHSVFNQRPISIITARGHSPGTIQKGIQLFVDHGWLNQTPNYLTIYPVSNTNVRIELGDVNQKLGTAELKQRAIRNSVLRAFETYGYSDHHRFGMSDDDPKNLQLIIEEMTVLKKEFPRICFFVIETFNNRFVKHEIVESKVQSDYLKNHQEQLPLLK
ncbi:MAG: hypothetical protein B7Y39_06110 [Bdellovibrio sp. 28-41-41]|nr:MAG: hypothetical protein B7Y39_06110 [Bdellovibrio sp. 28-41-41]